ncbi:uncharacterized protein EURHEDRAFT_220569 [Aspergillus ruber CBS 135680]|uniref:Uncharacterized protein n=1 Tax=Aspergillus ruber (strain CBS 135680) TaxID=1388766 RepID=A0A017SQY8_ASPRC|nr:uncharacterized protein EURHEDRAFT_220569 [Aspergillus ruber CBS 135680]EYE98680.1 hypothetical protein EURHEDRAFT_220569 [Aspergillus ruber CBS 135680]
MKQISVGSTLLPVLCSPQCSYRQQYLGKSRDMPYWVSAPRILAANQSAYIDTSGTTGPIGGRLWLKISGVITYRV